MSCAFIEATVAYDEVIVAPVSAEPSGACRAGQGRVSGERSERTIDAPKSSRTIGSGATEPSLPIIP
jgi:hypothetical protein